MGTNLSIYTSSLTCLYALVAFSFLTWMILVLTACKIYRFFSEFERFKSQNDIELNSITWHVKKSDETNEALLNEIRHANKLLYELSRSGKIVEQEKIDYSHEDILRHHSKQVEQDEKKEKNKETLAGEDGVATPHKAKDIEKKLAVQEDKPHNIVEIEKRLQGIQEFIETDTGLNSLQEFRSKLLCRKPGKEDQHE